MNVSSAKRNIPKDIKSLKSNLFYMSITSILCKNGGQPPCNTIASSYKATKIIISQNNPEHKFENTFVNYFSVNSRGGSGGLGW